MMFTPMNCNRVSILDLSFSTKYNVTQVVRDTSKCRLPKGTEYELLTNADAA
jgi:hypothetical protein